MHKVKKYFLDRDTGSAYQPGDTFSGTETRVAELQEGGYLNVTPVKEADGEGGKSRRAKADPDE